MIAVKNVVSGIPDTTIRPVPRDEGRVVPLPAVIGVHHSGAHVIVSRWQPTPAERATLLSGGDIYLHVFDLQMMPVMLTTDPPIAAMKSTQGPVRILTADHRDYPGLSARPGIGG